MRSWWRVLWVLPLALAGCGGEPEAIPDGERVLAPEIVGEDVDGVPFKLSDYRGKVVVLDFWGNW